VDGTARGDPLGGFMEELGNLVPPALDANKVPGVAIGVVREGRVWATVALGDADGARRIPLSDGHVFNVGSISKTVTSWGVLRLVEAGRLDLDAPVSRYLSRWRLPNSKFGHDGVTPRRLLSHTAGLSLSGYPGFAPGHVLPSLEESLSGSTNGAGSVHVEREPGSSWKYSGGGYTLAQLLIEEVSGKPFAEYMRTEVLLPLGMTSSSFVWNEAIDPAAAKPHGPDGRPMDARRFTAMAAAGLQTTVADMTRFALASMGRLGGRSGTQGVLRRETLELMRTPVAVVPPNAVTALLDPDILRRKGAVAYGLGYQLSRVGSVDLASHGGVNEGWVALLYVAPDLGEGIVIMTNGSGGIDVCLRVICRWLARISGERCGAHG